MAASPRPDAAPRRLVVLVPALLGHTKRWAQLRRRLEEVPGYAPHEATWLDFNHGTHPLSFGHVARLAQRLCDRINQEWEKRDGRIDDIVLVGHSLGALIVREAYLRAARLTPTTRPGAEGGEQPAWEAAVPWGARVSRILLFAGVNRGLDMSPLPRQALLRVVKALPLPHYRVEDAVRGSEFITNLRVSWLRHFGRAEHAERAGETWTDGRPLRAPRVFQLLGSDDGIVSADDSEDVLVFRNSRHVRIPDATHASLYRLDKAEDPDGRFALIRGAFEDEPTRLAAPAPDAPDRVVFLLHGIRASGVDDWVKGLEAELAQRAAAAGEKVLVVKPDYGYFSAARFALPNVRRRNIAWFQDQYTELLARYPRAEFEFIGHSNGTYIFGHSLRTTPGMCFRNVALAGSVLPNDFPWGTLKERGQVTRVLNERASRDWPVALLCNGLNSLRQRDVGTAGFAGFRGAVASEVAYHAGGHGAALASPENRARLVDFALGREIAAPALPSDPGYFRQLSNAMRYVTPALVAAAAVGVAMFVRHDGGIDADRLLYSGLGLLGVWVALNII